MNNKNNRTLIIIVICFLVLFIAHTYYPRSIIPNKEHSSIVFDYVLVDGKEITVSEEQANKIVAILERYKAHKTYNFRVTDYQEYDPSIYIVLLLKNPEGHNIAGIAICISDECQLAGSTTDFLSHLYKSIYNGKDLKDKILEVVH
ncbi:MAG: hypothetical protein II725_00570 [Firmicutes bacterium]|nr:hypothetical protein [Bacillota bacterium]